MFSWHHSFFGILRGVLRWTNRSRQTLENPGRGPGIRYATPVASQGERHHVGLWQPRIVGLLWGRYLFHCTHPCRFETSFYHLVLGWCQNCTGNVAAASRDFESVSALVDLLFDIGQSETWWSLPIGSNCKKPTRTNLFSWQYSVLFCFLESSKKTYG